MRAKLLYIVEFILEHILRRPFTPSFFITRGFPIKGVCRRCGKPIYLPAPVAKHKAFKWEAYVECEHCGFKISCQRTLFYDAVKGACDNWNRLFDENYGAVNVFDDFS